MSSGPGEPPDFRPGANVVLTGGKSEVQRGAGTFLRLHSCAVEEAGAPPLSSSLPTALFSLLHHGR